MSKLAECATRANKPLACARLHPFRSRAMGRPACMFAGSVMGWEQRSDSHCRALPPRACGNMPERYSKLVLVDIFQITDF